MILATLHKALGYTFTDQDLIKTALRHRSARGHSNERLEFLGDSILNFVIAEALFERFPKAKEGDLSRSRASLVKGETLADIAQEMQLGEYLSLGAGELKSGGNRRRSILADTVEAIIAAIYFDAGFDTCKQCILRWFEARLNTADLSKNNKDPKTQLQEYLQARHLALPQYDVISITGEAHHQSFHLVCSVTGVELRAEGKGTSRRAAEQEAAAAYLTLLKESS